MAMDQTRRYSQAGSQALRHGLHLAGNPVGACRAGGVLLRGSPALAGWVADWFTAEFPPLTGHVLSQMAVSPVSRAASRWAVQRADDVLTEALREPFGAGYGEAVRQPIGAVAPHAPHGGLLQAAGDRRRYAAQSSDIAYGGAGRNHMLDIWRPAGLASGERAPVLVQIPGGGWTINDKRGQAYPLMSRMVALGWVCVSINYSRCPRHAWPAQIIDVKKAISWVREHIAEYGGDPGFIALTGGSAGAHLASLAALTADDASLQPGFENADTGVQAVAPYYGVYDFTDPRKMHELMLPFLEHFVMQTRYAARPDVFEFASPISHVRADAPPFFMLHGADDTVVPSVQAQTFSAALRTAGAETVAYAELPHAHHAFDTVSTLRSQIAAAAVADFLGVVYGRYLGSRPATIPVVAASAG
jgi:acetyl esterase/lipase